MCGRFLVLSSGAGLANWFNFDGGPDLAPRYNVAPSQPIPIVRMASSVVWLLLTQE